MKRASIISCILTSILAISQGLFLSSRDEAKAQSNRPYIVLVNGWQNCCAWGIKDRFPPMNAEFRFVPYSNFSQGGNSGNTSDDSAFLRDGANFINNELDKNRPLILIGHSFGGDSVLKLLPRINRRIQFVAVIDPVRTGGLRASLKNLRVPSNVDYFLNRWQENLPFPNDFGTNGSIPCDAKTCDQDSQNIARNADYSPVTTECRWDEVTCPGFVAPIPFVREGKKGRKQVRVSHQDLPKDAFLQKDLGDKIKKQLASQLVSTSAPSGASIPVNFGNTLFYDRNSGVCTFVAGNGSVIQRLTTCRRTWHSVVYTANKLLFYDRAGDLEIYNVNQQGLASKLQSFTNAQNRVRKTWAQITSSQEGVVTFKDDNGQVENYRLNQLGLLERI